MDDEQRRNPYSSPSALPSPERFKGIPFPLTEVVAITPAVRADAHIARHGTGSCVIRLISGVVGALTTALTIALVVHLFQTDVSWGAASTILPLFALASLALWTWALAGRRALRTVLIGTYGRQTPTALHYEFTAEGVTMLSVDDSEPEQHQAWDGFVKRKEHGGVLLLFTSRSRCFIFPTQQLSVAAQDVLREIM